jgi:hypothetical protein
VNTTPTLHGIPQWHPGCGYMMLHNDAMAFWQSRMTTAGHRADPPDLVDLEALARDVRACYAEVCGHA